MASSTRPDKGRKSQRGLSRLRRARSAEREKPSRSIEDFVVITGFSGAGKSQAMATFEDAGYFCVDNLPPGMVGSLADVFGHEGSKVERAAVASDVRGGGFFDGLPGIGPTRKRVLLKHFGSPDAVLSASREELEAVPGLPAKTARDLWTRLHKTGH